MTILLTALLTLSAQAPAQPVPAPLPAATATPAPAPATQAKFTLDTPLETLRADPAAKAVLIANMGGNDLGAHPMYEQFKGMSLNQMAVYVGDRFPPDALKKIAAELAAIK